MPRSPGPWLPLAALATLVAACEPTIAELPGAPVAVAGAPRATPTSGMPPAIIEATPYVASPSPDRQDAPAQAATAAPGAPPSEGPPPGYPRVLRLRGVVHDDGGRPLAGATVRVRALLAEAAYDRAATTGADGAYRLDDAPAGLALAIAAHKPGHTARRRVATLPARPDGHAVDFGAPAGAASATEAAPFFLSSRPEIVAVSPDEDDPRSPHDEVAFTLTLSEPLDAPSRDRLAEALRVLPASASAVGEGLDGRAPDLREADRDADVDVDGGDLAWVIRPGTRFPPGDGKPAEAAWRSDTTLRFVVPASLLSSRTTRIAHQLAIVCPPDGARIEDDTFHQLGTDAAGDLNGYPPPGHLVRHAFLAPDLARAWADARPGDDGGARWAATHRDAARTQMDEDREAPGLARVDAGRAGLDGAITLTFDEPLVAFDGTAAGHRGAGLGATADGALAFTFAVAEDEEALAGVALDGAADELVDGRAGTRLGAERFGRELAFVAAAARGAREGAPPGSLVIDADPADARRVRLLVVGRPFWFEGVGAIKVRVAGFGDPAGNVRDAGRADAEVRTRALASPTP